jgi:copper homeostasis protein CutC
LPGGGIRADNLLELLRRSGCTAAHVGASLPITDGSLDHLPDLNLCDSRCLAGHRYRQLDAAAVTAVAKVAEAWRPSP